MNTKLEEYRLKLDSTKYVVSDNEAKMLAAFRDQCTRIGCSDHYLNKQLQHAFESEEIHVTRHQVEKVNCKAVQAVFRHVRKVVSNVRRSHKQQQLTRNVQSYSDTRFNGALLMLDSFRQVFFELPLVLNSGVTVGDYTSVDKTILDDVCDFLDPFKEVIDALSEDQQPSLHRVIPLRQCLIKKCQLEEEDSPAIIQLKVFLGTDMAIESRRSDSPVDRLQSCSSEFLRCNLGLFFIL